MSGEKDQGYSIEYAWDLNKSDKHYGMPYYEKKGQENDSLPCNNTKKNC